MNPEGVLQAKARSKPRSKASKEPQQKEGSHPLPPLGGPSTHMSTTTSKMLPPATR
jgi:hypothetical protein